jgi:hypothetical protein
VKAVISEIVALELANYVIEADFLKKAIVRHRAMLRDFDLEETAVDRALWSTLDGKWTFDDIDASSL